MPNADDITIRPLRPELLDDYLAFFDERAFSDNTDWAGCYCYFPYYDHAARDWQERPGEANREAIITAIKGGQASGYLAYAGSRVVGWCNAAPRERYPLLRELPGDGASTGATPCFIIDPDWRGQGIASKLLDAAVEGLREQGMARMEGSPMAEPKTAAERYHGTVELFEKAGYGKIDELPSGYIVMERKL